MASAALAPGAGKDAGRAPKPLVLWAIALVGCAAAAVSFRLALTNDQLRQPALRAILTDWITLPYIAAGLVAWWRRPGTRFGPLMVAAGFINFLATLQGATSEPWSTIGVVFDLLAPAVFLHVFLAFPGGRLERRFDRVLVTAAYLAAIGLQLVRMLLGGAGHTLLQLTAQPAAAQTVLVVQLVGMSALCLAGTGVLAARRRRAGRPLRRTRTMLVDSFALGLVMIAVLFLSEAFDGPGVEPLRWAAFAAVGIAPVAFLIALLDARLARSALGDLFVELRADPGPAQLRDCRASPSGSWATRSTTRQAVGVEATGPNRAGWSRSTARSDRQSSPSASSTARSRSTAASGCRRWASGCCQPSAAVSPRRSANSRSSAAPAWPTTPAPSVVTSKRTTSW